MPTLNQIADSIANNLKQPFNHELKERVKDYVKQELATLIRRSTKEHGIDEQLILTYDSEIIKVNLYDEPVEEDVKGYKLRSKYRIHKPVRIKNDSPFIYVGTIDGLHSFPIRNEREATIMHSFSFIGESYSYYISNGYIYINTRPHNRYKSKYIRIKAIFENPDEVLSMYDDIDGQDIELPIPIDMIPLFIDKVIQRIGVIRPRDISIEQEKEEHER